MSVKLARAFLVVGPILFLQWLPSGPARAASPVACPAGKTLDASRDLSKLVPNTANMQPNQPAIDSAPLLQAAITYAADSANGYSKITVDAGDYYFLTPASQYFKKLAYVEVPPKTSCLTLSFNGASFFFTQPSYIAFYLAGCASCVLRDVSIDFGNTTAPGSTLPFTQLLVTNPPGVDNTIQVSTQQGTGGATMFPTPTQLQASQSPFKPLMVGFDTRRGLPVYTYGRWNDVSVTSDTELALGADASSIQEGDVFLLAARAGGPAIQIENSPATILQNVSIYTSGGPAIEAGLSNQLSLIGIRVEPRPGSNRLMSTAAGGIELNGLGANNKIQDCVIASASDDSIAGYASGYGVVSSSAPVSANQFTLLGKSNLAVTPNSSQVSFVNGQTGLPLGGGQIGSSFTVAGYDTGTDQMTITPALTPAQQQALPESRVIDPGNSLPGLGLDVNHNIIADSYLARGIAFTGISGADIRNNIVIGTQQAGIYVGMSLACKAQQPNCASGSVQDIDITANSLIWTNQGLTGINDTMLGALEVSAINASGTLLPQQTTQPNHKIAIANNRISGTMRTGIWVGSIIGGVVASNNALSDVAQGTGSNPPYNSGLGSTPHLPTGLSCQQAQVAFADAVFNWCSTMAGPASAGSACPAVVTGVHCNGVSMQ